MAGSTGDKKASEMSFIEVDPNRLDEEWVDQPRLFLKYAERKADAERDFAEVKSDLEVVEAELDIAVRATPDTFGIKKVTESAVKSTILLQTDYQTALSKLHKAKHKVDVLDAVVKALQHRKSALESLVTLHGQSYFATPRTKGSDREATAEFEKRAARTRTRGRGDDVD